MKFQRHTLLLVALAAIVLLVLAFDANAQCSMCKAVLTGSNNGRFIRNFNIGVLVLLLPPVSIFCSIFIILRKHRGDGADNETNDVAS